MPAVTVKTGGQTASASYTTGPVTGGPSRPMPVVPHVAYTALFRAGDTFAQACKRLTSYAVIDLPAGFDGEIVDFKDVNAMGLYLPNVLGFAGPGPTQARITMRPMSATVHGTQTLRQAQGIDDNQSTGLRPYPTVNSGWALQGTEQMNEFQSQSGRTLPMLYPGVINYIGRSSWWGNMKVSGFPGDFYYPPGETFQINDYKTADAYYFNIEVDGRIAVGPNAGMRVGGSPFGSNGSKRVLLEWLNVHDSRASSMTFSYAGSEDAGQNTDTVTIRDCRIENNANHDTVPGHRFTGVNFEGVRGAIRIERCTTILDNPTLYWDADHYSFASQYVDNPDIEIRDPKWNTLHPAYNKCLVVGAPAGYGAGNKQTTPPKVFFGSTQARAFKTVGPPPNGVTYPVDPARDFIWRT